MRALSLWQPWAWAIIHAGKDVENRVWRTKHRGDLVIHASKRKPTVAEAESFLKLLEDIGGTTRLAMIPGPGPTLRIDYIRNTLPRGGVVGVVEVTGCSRGESQSPWAFRDQYQWSLRNPRPMTFNPMKGQRGFFNVDEVLIVERG